MKQRAIIVTGGSGFLGSNVVRLLNQQGRKNIVIVDGYSEEKFRNLRDLEFIDYLSYRKGVLALSEELLKYDIEAILHIGANANVLVRDAEAMLEANYEHSKFYLHLALSKKVPMIYASSSAVYGHSKTSRIDAAFEDPHNVYAWSKWIFDKYVQSNLGQFSSKVIGLRLFNIFGKGEFHKGENASLPFRFFHFLKDRGTIELFRNPIERDYVWVEDVASIFIELMETTAVENGIYNLGSGRTLSHRALAEIVLEEVQRSGIAENKQLGISEVDMPADLIHNFQFYTRAEGLIPLIEGKTAGQQEKIRAYVQQLIEISRGADDPAFRR